MTNFYLIKSGFLPELKCPCCGTTYDIEWHTEYGDPIAGTHEAICEECEVTFCFSSKVVYDTWGKK